MVWTPDFRQWRSVVGWKWVWSVCLVFWSPKFLAFLFHVKSVAKKVRGKKENNLMFLVSLSLLLLQNFPHVSCPLLQVQKWLQLLLWVLLSVPLVWRISYKIPKNPNSLSTRMLTNSQTKNTHSHIQKKSSHKFQTKKESPIQKQTQQQQQQQNPH